MAEVQHLVQELLESEEAMKPLYEELARSVTGRNEQKVASQLLQYERLQILSLQLLQGDVPESFLGFGRVKGDGVNVREAPSSRSELVRHAHDGEQVIVCGYEGYWVEVQTLSGAKGWIFKDYVQPESA